MARRADGWRGGLSARAAWWLAVATVCLVGCSDEAGPTCGPGTTRVDDQCVPEQPVDGCGSGTVRDGQTCYPVAADAGGDDAAGADAGAQDAGAEDAPAGDAAGCDPGCAPGYVCAAGACEVVPMPPAWTCAPVAYADGETCDCGCGAADPDCADPKLPVAGCVGATTCNPDGTCPTCTPDCAGKACGDDGCGGSCGSCLDAAKPVCLNGVCSACVPDCAGKQCGDDGCGGTCGTCAIGKACLGGTCGDPPADASCFGHCGQVTPSGCACTADCKAAGNCCANVHVCGCLPTCAGKQCGDDGCGGSCGTCSAGTVCAGGSCTPAVCTESTCNGHGTCKPKTATCDCAVGYAGPVCDGCKLGYVGYPTCVTACDDDGACDDGNACTDDSCSATKGCLNAPSAATCTDGDACTSGDTCTDGSCASGPATDCDDGNDCTADACDAKAGCSHTSKSAASCDDGDACTVNAGCKGSTCTVSGATQCDDGNACTDDSCDKKAGCVHLPNGVTCADNDKCSAGSTCVGAVCTSLGPINCDDGNSCTVDSCVAGTGACAHSKAAAGSACDDGNPCSAGDTCSAKGACVAGPAVCALQVSKGLIGHYSAAFSSTFDFDEDGGVTQWRDLSGGGHHLNVVDTGKRPKRLSGLVHGRPGVRFAGSAGLRSKAFARGKAATAIGVVCTDGSKALGSVAAHGDGAAGWAIEQLPGAATSVHAQSAGSDGGAKATLASSTCYVVAARASAAARDLATTATLTDVAAGAGAALTAGDAMLHLGTNAANAPSGAVVAELLVFSRALTDAERASVVTYLRVAWAFPVPQPNFAWYDAADLATVVTATDGSGKVTTWLDKSGAGKHATVGSDKAPTWLATATGNGKPAIRFDGAQVRLTTQAYPTSPQLTIFTVFEMDKPQKWGAVYAQGHDKYFSLRKTEKVAGHLNWHVRDDDLKPVVQLELGKWRVWTAVQDGTTGTLYNEVAKPAKAKQAPIPAGQASLTLGNAGLGGNESMGGWLAEIRAYAVALHPLDRALVEQLLRTKYGL